MFALHILLKQVVLLLLEQDIRFDSPRAMHAPLFPFFLPLRQLEVEYLFSILC